MFRFRGLIFLALYFAATISQAETATTPKVFRPYDHPLVFLSYVSWKEKVDLQNSASSDASTADFFGLALGVGIEHYFKLRHGYELDAQVMSGQAGVGSGDKNQSYQPSAKSTWWGVTTSARYSYRLTEPITFSVGPTLLERQAHMANGTNGSTVHLGSSLNFGVIGGMRLRLVKGLEIQQSIGTLFGRGSTIWSLALGYRF